MPRPRLPKNRGFPPNLYWEKALNQFRYRRPDNKKSHYLGRDKINAVSAAKKLNSMLMPGEDLVAKVITGGKTLSEYINERFVPIHLPERELAGSTVNGYMNQFEYIHKGIGGYPVQSVTIKIVGEFLGSIKAARQSNKYRSLLSMVFDYAKGEGYINTNPAQDTLKRKDKKKRQRLKLEEYKAIHELAGKQGMSWMQDAMDFALIVLQRREEVAKARFDDISLEKHSGKDVELLRIIQKKTKKHGKSAYIKVSVIGALKRFIEKRKQTGIDSPFIIHCIPSRKRKSKDRVHITQVLPDYISREFSRLRDATGLFDDMKDEEKPTFQEIRSLAIYLHDDDDHNAQTLAGHTNRQMTEAYKKGHEIEWTYAEPADPTDL